MGKLVAFTSCLIHTFKRSSSSHHRLAHICIYIGVQRIKRLFRQARRSKRAIVFIDEFDALARIRRSTTGGGSAEMDAENTLNQLLTEMDGFQTQDNVIVLASTNRPEVLDAAALRPGRFDRKVRRKRHIYSPPLRLFTLVSPPSSLSRSLHPYH